MAKPEKYITVTLAVGSTVFAQVDNLDPDANDLSVWRVGSGGLGHIGHVTDEQDLDNLQLIIDNAEG